MGRNKTGRNDPCPCGSGKKYKKCCWRSDRRNDRVDPWKLKLNRFRDSEIDEKFQLFDSWVGNSEEFNGDFALESLGDLFYESARTELLGRFLEVMDLLRERREDLFDQFEGWMVRYWFLAELWSGNRPQDGLIQRLAGVYVDEIDAVSVCLKSLRYRGYRDEVLSLCENVWPEMDANMNIMPGAKKRFSEVGFNAELFERLDRVDSPETNEILEDLQKEEILQFYFDEPKMDYIMNFIRRLTGEEEGKWHVSDFHLQDPSGNPHKKVAGPDEHRENYHSICMEFARYLRIKRKVPWMKARMGASQIERYLLKRADRKLTANERPMEAMQREQRRKQKPEEDMPEPDRMLVPDTDSLEVYLNDYFSFMNAEYYRAVAFFHLLPLWMEFLAENELLDDRDMGRSLREVEQHKEALENAFIGNFPDPLLLDELENWPDPERGEVFLNTVKQE